MRDCAYAIADLLPHAPPMVLLDGVLGWDRGQINTTLTIRSGIPFFVESRGVPAHVGLEYMAQACGAYAGLEGLSFGRPVRLGFLLGTRNYHASVDWFNPGEKLNVSIHEVLRQDLMGVFDCRIMCDGVELASAQLNLYQPEDATTILDGV